MRGSFSFFGESPRAPKRAFFPRDGRLHSRAIFLPLQLIYGAVWGVSGRLHDVHRHDRHQPVMLGAHVQHGADPVIGADVLVGAVDSGGDGVPVGQVDDHDLLRAEFQVPAELLIAHFAPGPHGVADSLEFGGRPISTHRPSPPIPLPTGHRSRCRHLPAGAGHPGRR